MAFCAGCKLEIDNNMCMKCTQCSEWYDLLCAGLTTVRFKALSSAKLNSWICISCLSQIPKTGNTNTLVRLFPSLNNCTGNNNGNANNSTAEIEETSLLDLGIEYENVRVGRGQYEKTEKSPCCEAEVPKCVCVDLTSLRNIIREELTAALANPVLLMESILGQSAKQSNLLNKVLGAIAMATRFNEDVANSPAFKHAQTQIVKNTAQKKPSKVKTPHSTTHLNTTLTSLPHFSGTNVHKSPRKTILPNPKEVIAQQSASSGGDSPNNVACGNTYVGESGGIDNTEWTEVKRKRNRRINGGRVLSYGDAVKSGESARGGSGSAGSGRGAGSHGDEYGVRRGTAAPGTTALCAAERRRQLHLYYVQEGTTAEQVRAHLTTICGSDVCTVDSLKPRGSYASFKLGVPTKFSELVLSPDNWAEDICVKPWRQNFRVGQGKKRSSGSSSD